MQHTSFQRWASVVLVAMALAAPSMAPVFGFPAPTEEIVEEVGEVAHPVEEAFEILGAQLAQDAIGGPQIPGLDGTFVASDSPLFLLNYPVPETQSSAHRAAEPSVGVNWNTNRAFLMLNLGVARAEWDDTTTPPAVTWKDVTHPITAARTLDPILLTDPVTGRTWAVQLSGEHSNVVFTDDDGESWTPTQPPTAAPSFDHQAVGVGPYPEAFAALRDNNPVYPHPLYYCAQSGTSFGQCARSLDGGLNWEAPLPMNTLNCGGLHSTVMVGPDGTVYVPHKSCSGQQGWMQSTDMGATWTRVLIPGSVASRSDPNIAIDDANNRYVAWSHGTPGGRALARVLDKDGAWGPVTDLGAPYGIVNTAFPETVAGDDGRAAVAFLGTQTPGDLEATAFLGEWHLYVSFTYDRGVTWTTVDATPLDPVQRGCIWLRGGGNPCRNLLDFNGIAIDRDGRVIVAIADGCTTNSCILRGGQPFFSRDALGVLVRQTGGPTLRASQDPAPAQPVVAFARGARTPEGVGAVVDAAAMGGRPGYSFAWDLDGDGAFDDAATREALFPPSPAGVYAVRVEATDADGASAVAEALVRVQRAGASLASWGWDGSPDCGDQEGWFNTAGFVISTSFVTIGGVPWHLTADRPASAPCSWFHSIDPEQNYLPAQTWNLESPCLFLPPNARSARLLYDLSGETEEEFDFLFVQVRRGGCVPDAASAAATPVGTIITLAQIDGQHGDLLAEPPVYETLTSSLDDLLDTGGGVFQLRYRIQIDDFEERMGFHLDNVRVLVDDDPPAFVGLEDATMTSLEVLEFTVQAVDPEDDPLTYGAGPLPPGATFDPDTRAFRFAPTFAQAPGVYAATFTVTDGMHTVSETITITVVNLPPVAAGTADPTTVDRVRPVKFRSQSYDLDGTVAAHRWDFGDGKTSTDAHPAHLYKQLGTFPVTLTVTDDDGDTDSAHVADITVVNVPPKGKVQAQGGGQGQGTPEYEANRADPTQFRDASTDVDGEVVAWAWDFGDGGTASGRDPSHQYAALGVYTARVVPTDNDGDAGPTGLATVRVVNLAPQAAFGWDPGHPMFLRPVTFRDASTDRDGTVASWAWDFGDGFTSRERDPVHVFTRGGWHTVSLTVEDSDGARSSVAQQVHICAPGVDVATLVELQRFRLSYEACIRVNEDLLPA